MLKGLGIGAIIKLALAVMIASMFISISTIGSLGDALQHSFENVDTVTDTTTEVEDAETLSDLTLFVRDRAIDEGCDAVAKVNEGDAESSHIHGENDGYPGLEGTRLTREPSCFGGESGLLREGLSGASPAPDGAILGGPDLDENFMPGIFSREKFEVVGDIEDEQQMHELQINVNEDEIWLEDDEEGLLITHDVQVKDVGDAIRAAEEDDDGGIVTGGRVMGALATAICPKCAAVGAVLYIGGDTIYHASPLSDSETEVQRVQIFFTDPDVDLGDRTNIDDIEGQIPDDADEDEIEDLDLTPIAQLCPGDEGYVQASRTYPDHDGHTSDEPLYPIIVIEEIEHETCGDWADEEDFSGLPHGPQLYIHSAADDQFIRDPSAVWPDAYEFKLRSEEDRSTWKASLPLESDRCQIYYRQRRVGTDNREFVTVRSYNLDTIVDYDQETFRHNNGDGLARIESDHRGATSGADAYELMEEMSEETGGSGLDRSMITEADNVGQLRVSTTANYGFNELYGDLLCANPDNQNYGEWFLCNEELDSQYQEIGDRYCNTDTREWEGEQLDLTEPYSGPTTGNQLFIRSGGGSTYEWPGAQSFEILEHGNRRGDDWVRPYTDVGGDENQCEIYYHHDAGTLSDDGTTLRTYGLYTTVDKNQETFRDGGGFTYIDQAHRTEERGGAHQDDRKINAYTLFNRISNDGDTDGTGLDGASMTPPEASGELRTQTSAEGFNELYGDLLCANPDHEAYAQWHVCNENLADEKMEIRNTNYGAAEEYIDYSCDPSEGEWNRETGSHR